jgi:hypothetical protein
VPVKKSPLATTINQIIISEMFNPVSLLSTLKQYYRKAPFLNDYYPEIEKILCNGETRLSTININTVRFVLNLLELDIQILLSSELSIQNQDSNLRLIEICSEVRADKYLSGNGGKKYINTSLFAESGIEVLWQDFNVEAISYPQIGDNFISSLSVIDVLMNVGKDGLKNILKVK